MTWSTAANTPPSELRKLAQAAQQTPLPPINTSLTSPSGFVVDLGEQKRVAYLVAGSSGGARRMTTGQDLEHVSVSSYLLHAADVARLRKYSYVLVDESSCAGPYHLATLVVALSLAGIPVATARLPLISRAMIDYPLLELTDSVDEHATRDPGPRETLSIAIRRRAHRVHGTHMPREAEPRVCIVIASVDEHHTTRLRDEVARQTWPHIHTSLNGERSTDAALVTEFDPTVTYGPHHIEDLVLALHYGGAERVGSAARFCMDPQLGVVVEQPGATGEGLGHRLMPGTTLSQNSRRSTDDDTQATYVIHGCNAVALQNRDRMQHFEAQDLVATHHRPPPQLSWLTFPGEAGGHTSYFARANTLDRT